MAEVFLTVINLKIACKTKHWNFEKYHLNKKHSA
jgi:hypothetical protein